MTYAHGMIQWYFCLHFASALAVFLSCIMAQDFRTGYLTMTSAKSMFIAQLAGAGMGCILAPATFYMIYYAFPDIGRPGKMA